MHPKKIINKHTRVNTSKHNKHKKMVNLEMVYLFIFTEVNRTNTATRIVAYKKKTKKKTTKWHTCGLNAFHTANVRFEFFFISSSQFLPFSLKCWHFCCNTHLFSVKCFVLFCFCFFHFRCCRFCHIPLQLKRIQNLRYPSSK
jgi:hypothetical protein